MGKLVGYISLLGVAILLSLSTYLFKNNLQISAPKLEIEIILLGDVMLGRTVMLTAMEKDDPNYPFLKVADELQKADIVFANLENPIVKDCPPDETKVSLIFCADPFMIQGLQYANINVVNLANNHSLNYGNNGLEQTKNYLQDGNIAHTGTGELTVKEVNDTAFGFLGFDKSQQIAPELTMVEAQLIKESDSKVDVLIVAMHWGVEYQDTGLPGQEKLAKELIDFGADVVVGHHPHWVQNIEYIEGKPIYYSLGNFVFDQMFSKEVRSGLAIKMHFKDGKLLNDEQLPIYMEEWAQPGWVR